jgi:hypothetical protein
MRSGAARFPSRNMPAKRWPKGLLMCGWPKGALPWPTILSADRRDNGRDLAGYRLATKSGWRPVSPKGPIVQQMAKAILFFGKYMICVIFLDLNKKLIFFGNYWAIFGSDR